MQLTAFFYFKKKKKKKKKKGKQKAIYISVIVDAVYL